MPSALLLLLRVNGSRLKGHCMSKVKVSDGNEGLYTGLLQQQPMQ